MMPGPIVIRACDLCGQPIQQWTLQSGNTFGAPFWSDGKLEAPMMPEIPFLVKCPHCEQMLWIEAADIIEEVELDAVSEEDGPFPGAEPFLYPDEEEYLQFFIFRDVDEEEELYVRLHAWWCGNDPWRTDTSLNGGPERFSIPQRENMMRLSQLFGAEEPGDRVMLAELAREQGDFEEALEWLDGEFPKDWERGIEFLRQQCKKRDPRVLAVPMQEFDFDLDVAPVGGILRRLADRSKRWLMGIVVSFLGVDTKARELGKLDLPAREQRAVIDD